MQDDDAEDETFTVRFRSLPHGFAAGDVLEVEVVIEDPEGRLPGAARSLQVSSSERTTLDLKWTAPASGMVTGYDVHYTSSTIVADDAACCAPVDAGCTDAGHSGTDPSHTIERLNDGTRYRVRVRARSAGGAGEWSFGAGTTRQPAGSSVDLTALVVTAAAHPGATSRRIPAACRHRAVA